MVSFCNSRNRCPGIICRSLISRTANRAAFASSRPLLASSQDDNSNKPKILINSTVCFPGKDFRPPPTAPTRAPSAVDSSIMIISKNSRDSTPGAGNNLSQPSCRWNIPLARAPNQMRENTPQIQKQREMASKHVTGSSKQAGIDLAAVLATHRKVGRITHPD